MVNNCYTTIAMKVITPQLADFLIICKTSKDHEL